MSGDPLVSPETPKPGWAVRFDAAYGVGLMTFILAICVAALIDFLHRERWAFAIVEGAIVLGSAWGVVYALRLRRTILDMLRVLGR